MKKLIHISFISVCLILISGCLATGKGGILGTGLFKSNHSSESIMDSDDPEVIQAHYHGRAVMKLIQIGSIGLIVSFILLFTSAKFMPESTGLGLGGMAGSGALIATGLFERSLEKVAYPMLAVCGIMAVIALGLRLFQRFLPKKWRKSSGVESSENWPKLPAENID